MKQKHTVIVLLNFQDIENELDRFHPMKLVSPP
jgi:hypothetical protein